MPPQLCTHCKTARAQILRPKNHSRLCAACFTSVFESEVAATITSTALFHPGERIAIGASGGKDSCVLASVLKTLNDRYKWGLDLVLLSVDEGITGYRDHSLDAVRRNAKELDLPLHIVSYEELYGWSMDQVVAQIGKKGNCTYCGVFRRQALDRGAARLGVRHVVTGHNADDVAETVLMNLLRGDLMRLGRATGIVTSTPAAAVDGLKDADGDDGAGAGGEVGITNVKRSKPLMYAYEKEIVLYAHHKKLDYFSTECIYSPEAFRGSARTLIKNLERIRPESILDVVRSGIEMARLVPEADGGCRGACGAKGAKKEVIQPDDEDEGNGGCGTGNGRGSGGEMAEMERKLLMDERAEEMGTETEIQPRPVQNGVGADGVKGRQEATPAPHPASTTIVPVRPKKKDGAPRAAVALPGKQTLGRCERCGYLSSQAVCKACVLLEGLNKSRPRTAIAVDASHG
ncbi:cytosolic thiouridylase subunit Ctu1 [Zalaria obscura]|uniref:Cytosolic thiouridylase subunit Ctu1 n=1 Tax=Zalaria obscura TaxID=2024903 RepID=A0ACC3SIC1_9PEZI